MILVSSGEDTMILVSSGEDAVILVSSGEMQNKFAIVVEKLVTSRFVVSM